jgi:microcystin-dependent protein
MMDLNTGDHNCFSKFLLEWLSPVVVASGTHDLTLAASGSSGNSCVAIWPGLVSDNPYGEFFLVQNRHRTNNDSRMPNDGMLIWHADGTLNASGSNFLYNNSFTAHKLLRLMEADGLEQIETGKLADAGDYWQQSLAFNETSTPSSDRYDGSDSHVRVYNFSAAGASMSATFEVLQDVIPPGTVVAFAGEEASIPAGWLLCDGRAVSRTTYGALFAVVNTAHGQGDGSTTFNLPDYRGFFLRGADLASGNDPDAASRVALGPAPWTPEQVGSRQADATRAPGSPFTTNVSGSHQHPYYDRDLSATAGANTTMVDRYERGTSDAIYRAHLPTVTAVAGAHDHVVQGGDNETRPKNKYVNWIIKF